MKATEIHIGGKYIWDRWRGRWAAGANVGQYPEEALVTILGKGYGRGEWRVSSTTTNSDGITTTREFSAYSRNLHFTEAEWLPARAAYLAEAAARKAAEEARKDARKALVESYKDVLIESGVFSARDIERLEQGMQPYDFGFNIESIAALIDTARLSAYPTLEAV